MHGSPGSYCGRMRSNASCARPGLIYCTATTARLVHQQLKVLNSDSAPRPECPHVPGCSCGRMLTQSPACQAAFCRDAAPGEGVRKWHVQWAANLILIGPAHPRPCQDAALDACAP